MKTIGRFLFFVACGLLLTPTLAAAQQAVLYELTENVQVNMKGGIFGRHAYAALQGWAKVGTPICPEAVMAMSPSTETCTITAVGTDTVDLATGKGTISGTWATNVNLDNPADAAEVTVMTGTFTGDIDLTLALNKVAPLGFVTNGSFTIDGIAYPYPFSGTFRLPFASHAGKRIHGRHRRDAYYIDDDGKPFPVKMDERALGWPTVRFEVKFQ